MLKKYLLGLSFIISIPAAAQELTSYQDLQQSLIEGKLATITVAYYQCKITNPNSIPLPKATAVLRPQTFLIRDEGLIVAQGTWFSSKIPNAPENGINQRYNFELDNHNKMIGTIEFYRADNGQRSELHNIVLECELGNGVKIFN